MYYFPFGKELRKVEQINRSPKKAFVLGVYASAVHASWIGNNGKQKVAAFAVASEPEIFWTGADAEKIISSMEIPEPLGRLVAPANRNLNGPSGRTLDNLFLKPLGLDRSNTWLCDLLPESRVNTKQRQAINTHYSSEIINKYSLKLATIPDFDKTELDSRVRRDEILKELETSKAETVILLGDLPIYWFLRFHDKRFSKLAQFGESSNTYGKVHNIKINCKNYELIPLCHPRQANRLGNSSAKWNYLHESWIKQLKSE